MSDRQDVALPFPGAVVSVIGAARRLVERLAQPWLVQLVLRLALAVPFYKSGILKWHGFLQLNDTAIDLFTAFFSGLPLILTGWCLVGLGVGLVAPQIYGLAGHIGGGRGWPWWSASGTPPSWSALP